MVRTNLSKLSIFLIVAICLSNLLWTKWWNIQGIIVWDVASYYGYLTDAFNEPSQDTIPEERQFGGINPGLKYTTAPNGAKVMHTSMGLSFLYAPFYAVGRIAHTLKHGDAGYGLEEEYRVAMAFYGLFMLLIGLIALRKLMKEYFQDWIIALTLLVMVFGTNLLYYTDYEGCTSHVTNFSLLAVFLLLIKRWYRNSTLLNAVWIGLMAGLISLIRPSNVVFGVFVVLFGVTDFKSLRERLIFLGKKMHLLAVMAICAILVWVPQIIYWHNRTGDYLFYSYVGETFNFLDPNIIPGFFSWRKGWFVYTPIGVFMIAGFVFLYRYAKEMFWASVVFYVLFVWIIFSWWCWWYGGSFSCRAMVDSYAVLSLTLASFFTYLFSRKSILLRGLFVAVLGFLMWVNIFQTYQYQRQQLHFESMTREAYFYMFLNERKPPAELLDSPWDGT